MKFLKYIPREKPKTENQNPKVKFIKLKFHTINLEKCIHYLISSLTIFHLARSGDYKNGLVIPILFRIISKIIMTVRRGMMS